MCVFVLFVVFSSSAFEWSLGADQEFNNRVPIVRIRNVAKGLSHPALQAANKKEPRKSEWSALLVSFASWRSPLEQDCSSKTSAPRVVSVLRWFVPGIYELQSCSIFTAA